MTHIMYVDETYDAGSKYVVLVGFIIPLSSWHVIERKLRALKYEYFRDAEVSLKVIRKKNYDKRELWNRLTKTDQTTFNSRLWDLICDSYNTVMAALIDKEMMESKDRDLHFLLPYSFLLQRYQYFLQDVGSLGIVIMDKAHSSKEILGLYYDHKRFLRRGLPVQRNDFVLKTQGKEQVIKDYKYQKLTKICENLMFLDDGDSNLLQIADFVASAISGKFNRQKTEWYKRLEPIIRKGPNGTVEGYGLKFFPKPPSNGTKDV